MGWNASKGTSCQTNPMVHFDKTIIFPDRWYLPDFLYLSYFNVFAYDVKCETTDVAGDKTD